MTVIEANANYRNGKKVHSPPRFVESDADSLSAQLKGHWLRLFTPSSVTESRKFTSGEVTKLIGITDAHLRHLPLAAETPEPKRQHGDTAYSLQVRESRRMLSETQRCSESMRGRTSSGHRSHKFESWIRKTTTAAHVAQYFPMKSYRTSLSVLFGLQSSDLLHNYALCPAIRYDDLFSSMPRRPIRRSCAISRMIRRRLISRPAEHCRARTPGTPILVGPSFQTEGRYQAASGNGRLEALQSLCKPGQSYR
ncbi:hypothetical protein [Bradyrhizobium cosmicum]|uniref:hypothetical protein n=1 Tax=Bradyrhizobium cosmicum TaxID=1404864 RepID=UPI0028EE82AC|nr:hypothetical protein [Bradyrhizobium cosmicum]